MRELVVDNFAGGGGASTGIEMAIGRSVDIAINHDPAAIAMHRANHPGTEHYCESVWDVSPVEAVAGRPVALAWFSPDCKHFSKAKGGKPVEKAIRGLAWVALRWAATVGPRVIMLENVEEFKTWGPLKEGKPDPERKGQTFRSFVRALEHHGYVVEHRELRSCDYGAPTIRKRFFLIARCDGQPIVWPEPTHGNPKSEAVMNGRLLPWRTAASIIDWGIPCPSIFERTRPLAEATMRRIARGIMRFVVENPEPFIVQMEHSDGERFRGQALGEPLRTITAKNGYGIAVPVLTQYHGEKSAVEVRGQTLAEPIMTLDAANRYGLVSAMLTKFQQNSLGQPLEAPLHTAMAGAPRFGLVMSTMVQTGYGEAPGQQPRAPGLDKPLGTVVSTGKHAVVAAHLAKHYGGGYDGPGADMDSPLPTVTTVDHNALVTSHIVKLRGTNIGHTADEPLHTVTAGGKHLGEVRAFLIKYYGSGTGQACGDPLGTVLSRDKFGLVTIHGTQYAIVDIGMRMLTPRELFRGQGFPEDYIIDRDDQGNQTPIYQQVAKCGNAVTPPIPAALVRANLPELCRAEVL